MGSDTAARGEASPLSPPRNVWNDAAVGAARPWAPDRIWYRYALRLLQRTQLPPGRALDLGCGVGEFMEALKGLGYDVCGLDGEPQQVARVRERGAQAAVADLEAALPFADASFALLTCLEVIEHIARAEHLLSETRRVLAPGGHLLLSTPNFGVWHNRLRYCAGSGPVNEGVHLRFFTPRTLERRLAAVGLAVVARMSFGPLTGINLVRRLLGLPSAYVPVPRRLEPLFAEHMLYLARKSP
jgi:2-polyprenyl-3-methyl-5-hydroxy-6-metoxy-1,4-benzoquinol methylase